MNVCTIEDPIEMVEVLVQPDAGPAQHRSRFADGVRALMRQDPDIVMIGEIRDLKPPRWPSRRP